MPHSRSFFISLVLIIWSFFYFLPIVGAKHPPLLQYGTPGMAAELNSIFQVQTARNYKIISQALDFVSSMQTSPTCTRMAASHLMSECKLLEHAPDFARTSPEPYLDNVKTEYAAKLAVCELLSAQIGNPTPPTYCEILVPSVKACSKRAWFSARPETPGHKQCYPAFTDYQYNQCLKTLQSSPQYWTSFSNARQNAVVMCQASRDILERENHLETFKNLTQILGLAASTLKDSVNDYQNLAEGQREFVKHARDSQNSFTEDFRILQETVFSSVNDLDLRFKSFLESSITELIKSLSQDHSESLNKVRKDMELFSREMVLESSQIGKHFTDELQRQHERSLSILQASHAAQMESYGILYNYMGDINKAASSINRTIVISSSQLEDIEQRLTFLAGTTNGIAREFAFLTNIPSLLSSCAKFLVLVIGVISLLYFAHVINPRLARYIVGVSCSIHVFNSCCLHGILENTAVPLQEAASHDSGSLSAFIKPTSKRQQGIVIIVLLWVGAYTLAWVNAFIGHLLLTLFNLVFGLRRVHYGAGNHSMFLPSVEIPNHHLAQYLDLDGEGSAPAGKIYRNGSTDDSLHLKP